MAYEHQAEVNQASKAIIDGLMLGMDDVDNTIQAPQFISDALIAYNALGAAMSAESKKEYKAKVLIKLGVALVNRGSDILLPDSQS